MEINVAARSLKVTAMLDAAALAGVVVPNSASKVTLHVSTPGRSVTAEVNARSLRRAVAAIAEAGPDGVAMLLTGKLEGNNTVAEAGIAAQLKVPKAAAA
jgi:hypothetical protein